MSIVSNLVIAEDVDLTPQNHAGQESIPTSGAHFNAAVNTNQATNLWRSVPAGAPFSTIQKSISYRSAPQSAPVPSMPLSRSGLNN